jgi:hypothetical protein
MEEHLKLLGYEVKDIITGTAGIATSICFDLYGCVMATVTPPIGKDGKLEESRWFDTKRLAVVGDAPVMAAPDFASPPGPERKPTLPTSPLR